MAERIKSGSDPHSSYANHAHVVHSLDLRGGYCSRRGSLIEVHMHLLDTTNTNSALSLFLTESHNFFAGDSFREEHL